MLEKQCHVIKSGNHTQLVSPAFVYTLESSHVLKAVSFENRLCGKILEMGNGNELEADFDHAEARIAIEGWTVTDSPKSDADPNAEAGYVSGYYNSDFNDAAWDGFQTPVMFEDFKYDKTRYKWARTHVFIPESLKGKSLSVFLGGFGLLDFSFLRLFINGQEIGTRRADKRWHEPGCFVLEPSSESYASLRFGQDNILALQLSGYLCRNQKLDTYDPQEGRELATIGRSWPAQFEQYITAGTPLKTPVWSIHGERVVTEGENGRIDFDLVADSGLLSATVSYRWTHDSPVLHKFIEIKNNASKDIRMMNVRLGDYHTNEEPTEGEQGFPVYIDGCFFMSVAHPSGWATGQDCDVVLKQYPGKLLHAGESFSCMETLFGVSQEQKANESFIAHVESRMRRVKRGHDKATFVFDSFGSWPITPLELDYGHFPTEEAILHNIDCVAKGQTQDGCHFDYYTIEFWNDYYGDFTSPGPERFPHGFEPIQKELARLDTNLGLWIDTSAGRWSIGGNPVIKSCRTYPAEAYENDSQAVVLGECYCRAQEPYKAMFTNGFLHHIRQNHVRLLKFDDAMAICHNPNHDHLPGVYSTEAIHNAEIEMLNAFDRECPELFMILYWGHRSPWWLLHADTLFESGLFLEASTPASFPTLYARDGVTISLDQADFWCDDVPKLGKDSLGVWLSAWSWNSSIGKERWQEGIVMDLCRGSLLFQFWSDYDFLSTEERKQAALFMALLREGEDCFRHSKRILGNPWNNEPYGYCCSNGKRAFISINNCTWSDVTVQLSLEKWGLESNQQWDVTRWYPNPAKLEGDSEADGIALRPFEVVLLEIVPHGEVPTLSKNFESLPMISAFTKPTRKLELSIERLDEKDAAKVKLVDFLTGSGSFSRDTAAKSHEWNDTPKRILETPNLADYASYGKQVLRISAELPKYHKQGILFVSVKMRKDGMLFKLNNLGMHFAAEAKLNNNSIHCEPVIGLLTYAVPWQGWRIDLPESNGENRFELFITAMTPKGITLEFDGYFIPSERDL